MSQPINELTNINTHQQIYQNRPQEPDKQFQDDEKKSANNEDKAL